MKKLNVLGRNTFKQFSIFEKIIKKEIKADIVYENDKVLVFKDIAPVAPVHVLIIPKVVIKGISSVERQHSETLAELILASRHVGEILGLENGYRLVINEGSHGCQTVPHIHIHLIGGKQLNWPPGTGSLETNKNI